LPSHQDLLFDLAVLLRARLSSNSKLRVFLGVDVLLPGADNYICPDITVIESDKELDLNERPFKLVPRLLVEGLSPSTMGNDAGAKLQAFAEAGVPEYWIANPANGALSILTNPENLAYREMVGDADGFVRSSLLDQAIRVRRDRSRFIVETRA
jgi:Uma2 family endonuclease